MASVLQVDSLATRNMVPGESVYNEKRVSVEEGDQKVMLSMIMFFFFPDPTIAWICSAD